MKNKKVTGSHVIIKSFSNAFLLMIEQKCRRLTKPINVIRQMDYQTKFMSDIRERVNKNLNLFVKE